MNTQMTNLFEVFQEIKSFKQFYLDGVLCVEFTCIFPEGHSGIWSQHNYLFYVLTGEKIWIKDQTTWIAKEGEAVFIQKGAQMTFKKKEDNFCAICFFIPDDFVDRLLDEHKDSLSFPVEDYLDIPAVIEVDVNMHLKQFFDSVFSYFSNMMRPQQPILELKLKELILHLITGSNNKPLAHLLLSRYQIKKTSLKKIMYENYMYNLNLEEFARMSNRSLSSFKRDFDKVFGESPAKWILRKKLELSKSMLSNYEKNINEIAFECGFENSNHYIRAFKRFYETTPNKYRINVPSTTLKA